MSHHAGNSEANLKIMVGFIKLNHSELVIWPQKLR